MTEIPKKNRLCTGKIQEVHSTPSNSLAVIPAKRMATGPLDAICMYISQH
jgi:hypothetical protein